jgi:hypothetical protein
MTLEVIMKIRPSETPLHTDHQLDQLAAQFEHWRQTRAHSSERIPQHLWDQAAALARVLPHTRVAQHLRLSSSDLKKQMAAQCESQAVTPPTLPGFVEVPPVPDWPPAPTATQIELERPDGARLRIVTCESTLPLAALARTFLEGS